MLTSSPESDCAAASPAEYHVGAFAVAAAVARTGRTRCVGGGRVGGGRRPAAPNRHPHADVGKLCCQRILYCDVPVHGKPGAEGEQLIGTVCKHKAVALRKQTLDPVVKPRLEHLEFVLPVAPKRERPRPVLLNLEDAQLYHLATPLVVAAAVIVAVIVTTIITVIVAAPVTCVSLQAPRLSSAAPPRRVPRRA